MDAVEKAYAKLSKNAREWWEDFERATSSVEALQAAPPARSSARLPSASRGYSPNVLEKLSEKSRARSQDSPVGYREGPFWPISCSAYRPNQRSERCSYPFRTVSEGKFSEVRIAPVQQL